MTKEPRRQWLDNLTPDDRAKLRAEHEKTREPWDPKRRQRQMAARYRKQRSYIVQDMRRGASLQVTAKRYDLDYGLLVAMLEDDGLLVLQTDTGDTVRVTRSLR
jgi:hypothetical protein